MTFNAFKNVIKSGGVVRAIPATGAASQPRSFFDKLNEWARTEGAPGLGYVVFEEEGGKIVGKGPIAKFIPDEVQAAIREKAGLKAGDAVFFSAGTEDKAASLAGKARVRIGDELGLGDKNQFAFAWIVDFPQYEWNEDEKKIDFSHNPFSMANLDDEAFMALDPSDKERILKITALQYDMVCNGYELASGSIRNHRPDRMVKAFEIAGYGEAEVKEQFRRHVSRVPLRRAAARRHGGGYRPHRDAALRRGEPARDHPVPDEPAGRRPAARRAIRCVAQAASRIAHSSEPAGEMIPATAIVVTFDSAHALPDCLDALRADDVPVIVVDNGSLDDTVAIAEKRGATIVRNLRNEGYGRANNAGARAAASEFLLVVNPDVIVGNGAVAALIDAARRYPDAGLLAPQIVEPSGRVSSSRARSLRLSHQPPWQACAARRRGMRAVLLRRLFPRPARTLPAARRLRSKTSSCSTRTTISAAASPIAAPRSSTCRRPSCGMDADGRAGRSPAASSELAGIKPGRAPM